MQAFGIASLVISIVAIFSPLIGIFLSGLSGFLAWLSAGNGTTLGGAATIINVLNLFFLSPAYMLAVSLEKSKRTAEEASLFTVWAFILFIQIATIAIFFVNFLISKINFSSLKSHRYKNNSRNVIDSPLESVRSSRNELLCNDVIDISPNVNASKVTQVLIHKVHGGRKKDSKFWNDEIDTLSNKLIDKKTQTISNQGRAHNYSRYRVPWVYPIAASSVLLVALLSFRPEILKRFHQQDTIHDIRPQSSNEPAADFNTFSSPPKIAKTTPRKKTYKKPIKQSRRYLLKLKNGNEITASNVKTTDGRVKITYPNGLKATVSKSFVLSIEIL